MALELTPWRRSGELRPYWRDMDDLMTRFFRDMPMMREGAWDWVPTVDVTETDGNVMVKAELPGMDPKDIDIDITGDVLTLKGEKKSEEEKKDERYYFRERHYGSFQRTFQLPAGVDNDKVDANFKNGVLTVRIPKSEESKQKKIEIKAE